MKCCFANPFELVVLFHAVHIKAAIQMTLDWTSYTVSVFTHLFLYLLKEF